MPYGGNDEVKRKHFTGVYQSIIVPAVRMAGYEPKRSDLAGEPGNITHDIIRDLAESDLVIADLTAASANVFFELGIRHAFRKSGTVHIVDAAHSLPFDIRQYRAVEYTTDLSEIPDVVNSIAEAIKKRENQPERPDNPVHDALPQLPFDILQTSDSAIQQQLKILQQTLEDLRKKNESLTTKLRQIDPTLEVGNETEIDVDALLDHADSVMKSTGQYALLRLQQAMKEGGSDAFSKELRQVLKTPYLDENDFAEIVIFCKKAGLNEHRRAVLEIVRRQYPHSEQMFLELIDALDDSPNISDKERGRLMLEESLGIQHKNGLPRLSEKSVALPTQTSLGLLFNFYSKSQKHDWILSIIDSLPISLQKNSIVLRNKARSLAKLLRLDEAQEVYEELIQLDPSDDQSLLWYSNFLSDQGKFEEAYELAERSVIADPDDANLYINLAINIFNHGYCRDHDGKINGPISKKLRVKSMIPLILKAIEEAGPRVIESAVKILVRAEAIEEAQTLVQGQMPQGNYDTASLTYIQNRLNSANKESGET
jgi:tetratricopeptide (TPR) repeat protein